MQLFCGKIVAIAIIISKNLYNNCSNFISKGGAMWKVVRP